LGDNNNEYTKEFEQMEEVNKQINKAMLEAAKKIAGI